MLAGYLLKLIPYLINIAVKLLFFLSDHSTVRSMDTAVKLNQLIHEKSKESPLIMVNLPKPPSSVEKEFLCIFQTFFKNYASKLWKCGVFLTH